MTAMSHNEVTHMPPQADSECCYGFSEGGQPKREGTFYTASLAIMNKMIGPTGVMGLAWALTQFGWVAGPIVMTSFALVTCYTSTLLSECYRFADPITGKRHTAYIDVVKSSLDKVKVVKVCAPIWYCIIIGGTVGCTIAASKSMSAIIRSICLHKSSDRNPCHKSDNPSMIVFGAVQIILSQIPNFDQLPGLSIVTTVMSLTFSLVGIGLGITKVATDTKKFHGNQIGISNVTLSQEIWRRFQALGVIASIFSYPTTIPEIQDTIKSPTEAKSTMKKATLLGVGVTTLFYMLYACVGYASFGDSTPRNILTPFGFYKPFWLLDIANAAVAIHLAIAYQLYCRPLFALVEKFVGDRFPGGQFITQEIRDQIPDFRTNKLILFRLIWRTIFVMVTTIISMLLPFFNDYMVGILGALGLGPLAICFPIEMYITQTKIPKWSTEWVCLRILSLVCLVISIVAAIGSIVGIVHELKGYKPFKTRY